MRRRAVMSAWAAAWVLGVVGTAAAADIRLDGYIFQYNERAQISLSAELTNASPTASGPIILRLWATNDPRTSTTISADAFLLIEAVVEEGLAGGASTEANTGYMSIIEQPEQPEQGLYNVALTVDEDAFDADPTIVSFASSQTQFPLFEAPTEAEIRRRVASAVPCGSLFVQFSLVTFMGLCAMKWMGTGRRCSAR
ncbi:MAG TPA: hypothetical protein VM243_13960 [Phycisphaerae bacterium]|nr:hypothetical protein [Phycisphaerae bacterium]